MVILPLRLSQSFSFVSFVLSSCLFRPSEINFARLRFTCHIPAPDSSRQPITALRGALDFIAVDDCKTLRCFAERVLALWLLSLTVSTLESFALVLIWTWDCVSHSFSTLGLFFLSSFGTHSLGRFFTIAAPPPSSLESLAAQ